MVSSLSSTGAISFLSSLSSISDKPTSPSNVSVQKIPSLCFSHCISTRFLTRPRLASRLGPTEDVAASETPKSADWDTARSYKEKGVVFETKIEGFNAGGLLMKFQSLMAFLPYTLLNQARFCKDSPRPILERAKDLVGSSISVKVQDVKEQSRTIILSEKAAIWEKYSDQVEVGAIFKGIISSIEEYGAFVYLLFPDGLYSLSGMIHISEASWDLVPDMRDLVTEGDEIKVKVIEIDREKKKINLSLRQLEDDPLYTTLDKVILETNDTSDDYDAKIEPLPGLDNICQELLNEDGITDVQLGRQGFEKRVVSQDLELWLSNAPVKDNQVTLLARAGRQVQEVYLTTTLDQDGIKKAVQHILERVL